MNWLCKLAVVERMGKFCVDVQVMYAIRGNRIPRGTDVTKQIVIGTPGTVLDWCFKRKLIDLTKIRVFVLDEADVMIDTQGFADQSIRIQRALPSECQMLLFSATFEDSVWQFAERIIPDPNVIKLRKEELTPEQHPTVLRVVREQERQVPGSLQHLRRHHHRPGHHLLPDSSKC